MRTLALTISILAGAACAPGSGEFGSCTMTPDCQTKLFCQPPAVDGGSGVCRYACQLSTDCMNNELCGTNGYCSKDGGY